jgi:hypothetical protein
VVRAEASGKRVPEVAPAAVGGKVLVQVAVLEAAARAVGQVAQDPEVWDILAVVRVLVRAQVQALIQGLVQAVARVSARVELGPAQAARRPAKAVRENGSLRRRCCTVRRQEYPALAELAASMPLRKTTFARC